MGYWMHVYSQTDKVMEVEAIREFFEDEDVTVTVYGDQTGPGWKQIVLAHSDDDQAIADVHLHVGDVSGYVEAEIENVLQTEPACNAEWVAEFLRGVKTVYSFQILSGVDVSGGWEYVRDLMRVARGLRRHPARRGRGLFQPGGLSRNLGVLRRRQRRLVDGPARRQDGSLDVFPDGAK